MLGASLPENGNRASLIRWKENCVSELPRALFSLLDFLPLENGTDGVELPLYVVRLSCNVGAESPLYTV